MAEKVTSLKIDPKLWKRAKILAIERATTLKSLIEELLVNEVEAEELLGEELEFSEEQVKALEKERRNRKNPFTISIEKSAVELVREGRGE